VLTDEAGDVVLDAEEKPVMGPSQREQALTDLGEDFPHLATDLDTLVQASDAYREKSKGLDDPEDLKRLLRGAGVLEFRIAINATEPGVDVDALRLELAEGGALNTSSTRARWLPINDLKQWYDNPEQLAFLEADPVTFFRQRQLVAAEHEGTYYLLLSTVFDKTMTHEAERDWSLKRAFPNVDDFGRPCVAFELDDAGAALMGRLTGKNIGEPMAIVLDGEIFSAPTVQSQITKTGTITGNFSQPRASSARPSAPTTCAAAGRRS
jgi:preprotein translocase subunit SecD